MSEETLFCLRVRYVETGRLKFLSHLELLRAIERTIRRAGLPYAVTQGFSPRMKAAYCPALPVGVASEDEWFDVWLRQYLPAQDYLAALRAASVADLMPCEAAYVDLHAPSLSASLTISCWDAGLSVWPQMRGDWPLAPFGPNEVARAVGDVVAQGSIEYLRSGKPKTVKLDGRIAREPEVLGIEGVPEGALVRFATRSNNEGALRPDVFMGAVKRRLADLVAVGGSVRDADAVEDVLSRGYMRTSIVRTAQYLEKEDGTWQRPI